MRLTIERALMGGIFLAITGIAVITFLSLKQSERFQESSRLLSRTERLLVSSERVLFAVIDNETGARGYGLTGDPGFLAPLEASKQNIYDEVDQLKRLLTNDSVRNLLNDSLSFYIQKRIEISDQLVKTRNEKGLEAASQMVSAGIGKEYSDRIRSIIRTIAGDAETIFTKRYLQNERAAENLSNIIFWLLIGLIAALIGLYHKSEKGYPVKNKS